MYTLYGMRCWNTPKHNLYRHGQHWMYCVRSRVNLQYHHERGHVYYVCGSLRSRQYLPVYCLYRDHKQSVYGLYHLCGWNVQKHGLYGLGQYWVYLLSRRLDL